LIGVLVMLLPHLRGAASGGEALGVAFALMGATGASLATIQIRRLVGTEHTAAIVFYFSLFSAAIGLFTLPFGWMMPSVQEGAVLILIGLIGGVAQIMLTQSYRYADTSLIAPFDYTTILWATLIGYLAFGEVPSALVAVGAVAVVASGIFVILRERQLGIWRRERKVLKPPTA
jgi:drug/metabolite transporter (DMT)-like permease